MNLEWKRARKKAANQKGGKNEQKLDRKKRDSRRNLKSGGRRVCVTSPSGNARKKIMWVSDPKWKRNTGTWSEKGTINRKHGGSRVNGKGTTGGPKRNPEGKTDKETYLQKKVEGKQGKPTSLWEKK